MKNYFENYMKAINNPLPELRDTFDREFELLTTYLDIHCPRNATVVDLGCGAGRPLIDLAIKRGGERTYVGVDNDPQCIAEAERRKIIQGLKHFTFPNISFECKDMFDMKEREIGDLVYSTYNLISSIDPVNRPRLIQLQSQLTKPGGFVITTSWNTRSGTSSFLQKYYPSIGINVELYEISRTRTNIGTIHNVSCYEIEYLYKNNDITPIETRNLGVWDAVVGQKVKQNE